MEQEKEDTLFSLLNEAKKVICSMKLSMSIHPDHVPDSEFWDMTDTAQELEDRIETLINKQEMFESESKPLHKDTDLGYYAGLAMLGAITRGIPLSGKECIDAAKELIKQLTKKRNERTYPFSEQGQGYYT